MKIAAKTVSVLLAVLLALSFCACGKTDAPDTDKSADTKKVKETEKTNVSTAEAAYTAKATDEVTTEAPADRPYETVTPKNAGAGDIIVFGSYEQDGNKDNGKEPLEWLVLEREGDSLLIITLYGIESKVFNEEREYVTWETSTIRAWLNGEFLDTAFSSDERTMIKTSYLIAESNPDHPNTPAGGDTEDKVFLLSLQEADKYFKAPADKACSPTEALIASGGFTKSNKKKYVVNDYACLWWLRSPGMDKLKIAYVDKGGTASKSGNQADYNNNTCVRPAVRVTVN